jgi:hypothetical protein
MEAAKHIHPDTIIDDRPEGALDAEVARIVNENLSSSDGLDVAEAVLRPSMDGTDRGGGQRSDLSQVHCGLVSCNILS